MVRVKGCISWFLVSLCWVRFRWVSVMFWLVRVVVSVRFRLIRCGFVLGLVVLVRFVVCS